MENAANLMNPQNIAIIKQIFDYITKNGLVNTLRQLGQIMNAVGFFPSQHQEQKYFDENKRPDGTLDFGSVLNILGQHSQKEGPPKVEGSQLGQFQQMMDRNGDGKVDMQDLMTVMGGASGLAGALGGLGGGSGMGRASPQGQNMNAPHEGGGMTHEQQSGAGGPDYMGIASQLAGRFLNK